MNVTEYSKPLRETNDIRPHKSECIKLSTHADLLSLLVKIVLVYFPKAHPLHTTLCSVLNSGNPVTIYLNILKADDAYEPSSNAIAHKAHCRYYVSKHAGAEA